MTHFLKRWYALCKCTKFICKFCVLSSLRSQYSGQQCGTGRHSCPQQVSIGRPGWHTLGRVGSFSPFTARGGCKHFCGNAGCCGSEDCVCEAQHSCGTPVGSTAALIFSLDQFLQPALEKFAIKTWSSWDENFAFFHPSHSASTARQNIFIWRQR